MLAIDTHTGDDGLHPLSSRNCVISTLELGVAVLGLEMLTTRGRAATAFQVFNGARIANQCRVVLSWILFATPSLILTCGAARVPCRILIVN